MNIVCLMGRLAADPELKQTPNGTSVATFTVAVDRGFKDANGNRQVDFINCVAWRQTAEFVSRYFGKGNMMGLNGSMQSRQYETQDGQKRTVWEVVVSNAYFGGNANNGNSASNQTPAQRYPASRNYRANLSINPEPSQPQFQAQPQQQTFAPQPQQSRFIQPQQQYPQQNTYPTGFEPISNNGDLPF